MNKLFVKKLTVIDFSYLCPKRGLLGESWLVDVQLSGSLDHQGMVLDFSDVKKKVKQLIDEDFDHKLVIPEKYDGSTSKRSGKRLKNTFVLTDGRKIVHIAPESAYCLLPCEEISEQQMAEAITEKLGNILPDNVEQIEIRLYPEAIDGPYYHYSHGLKHHTGNCQRIAHGHRSRIEILEQDQHRHDLEQEWAERWKDIYIGTQNDIHEQYSENGTDYIHFRYTACQGLFELIIPASCCYLIDFDTTVENLAEYLASQIKISHPDINLSVYAYEGIEKGAISNTF
jgi:6-pyruvoyl-tetrahydropterin synthase